MPKLCDDVYAIVYLEEPRGSLTRVGGTGHGLIPCLCCKSKTSQHYDVFIYYTVISASASLSFVLEPLSQNDQKCHEQFCIWNKFSCST